MKARIQASDQAVTIELQGKINYETQDEVCKVINQALERYSRESTYKPIFINWAGVDFVGSTGITQFVQHVRALHAEVDRVPKYLNVKSEFQKIIKAFDSDQESHYSDANFSVDVASSDLPKRRLPPNQ